MQGSFSQRLRKLGKETTQSTLCLQNTRLGDKYFIFDLIAVGQHSTIYYGIQQKTKLERVFKFYNLKEIENQKGFKAKQIIKRLTNYEYSLRKECNSIHIIKQYDIYEDKNSKIIVSQYCNLGSLERQIRNRAKKETDYLKAIAILKQIIAAIKNIHKNCGIVHKNIKAKNILIQDGVYKIIDLGITTQESTDILIPQILLKKDYDYKAEIWNIGVIFHQILFGQLPAALTHNPKKLLVSNFFYCAFDNQKYCFHQYVKQFLQKCLQINPQNRMSWQQLQNHRIFQLIRSVPKKQQKVNDLMSERLSNILPISQQDEEEEFVKGKQRYSFYSVEYEIQVPTDFYSQKFNLQKEQKMIESELQQPYKKLGEYFEFQCLQPISWQPLRKKINKDIHKKYQQLTNYYLQCLKVDFVYLDIIIPLKKIPQWENKRQRVQFLYLLICRCFFQMSKLNLIVQDSKFRSKSQNVLISCIKKQTQRLYNGVKNDWNYFSQLMNKYQSQIGSILFDKLLSILHKQKFREKDAILSGIQGIDFQKDHQIQFTSKHYKQIIRKDLQECVADKSIKLDVIQVNFIIGYLDRYEQIWRIEKLPQAYMNFKQFMDQYRQTTNNEPLQQLKSPQLLTE